MKPSNSARGRTTGWAGTATAVLSLLLACSSGRGAGGGWASTSESPGDDASATGNSGVDDNGTLGGSDAALPDQAGMDASNVTITSSSGGSATTGSAGPQDAAAISDPDVDQTVTLTTDVFTVQPNQEVYNCQLFTNPFKKQADLIWMQGKMSQGSHHFFVFNVDPLSAVLYSKSLAPCPMGGLEIHPFPFLSQQPLWTMQYPTDSGGAPMGYSLPSANDLLLDVHFLNATSSAIRATASITIKIAKSGVVKTHVGSLFLNDTLISVPANATVQKPAVSNGSWGGNPGAASSDGSYSIFTSWSHMHRWGMGLTVSSNGTQFYSESNWQEPALFWHMPGYTSSPTATGPTQPVKMSATQGINWSCKDSNDTGKTLTFGESAQSNVMCIYVGQYYPANATSPDILYNP
jgi:hypothetical protein